MRSWRVAGVLWLLGGLASGALLPFMTDQLLTLLFGAGAVVGVALGVLAFLRPSADLARLAGIGGVLWLLAFGGVTVLHLADPIEQVVSVGVVAALGALGGLVASRAR